MSATGAIYEEQSPAQIDLPMLIAARAERCFSVTCEGGEAKIRVHCKDAHRLIVSRLQNEGLKPRFRTYEKFHRRLFWARLRSDPFKFFTMRQVGSNTVTHYKGDIDISVPASSYSNGEPNLFALKIMDALASLQGKRFSADDLNRVLLKIRGETMTREQWRNYMEALR